MKSMAKNTLCAAYKYTGALAAHERLAHWAGRRFAAILLFHRVTDVIPWDGLTVGTAYFRRLCEILRDRFHVVPLADVVRQLEDGQAPQRRTVAITFDDCYRDNLFAARVLAEHGLPASFFVPTQYVGTDHQFDWDRELPRMPNLTWDDIHEMVGLGHTIESHTVSHADLGLIDAAQARREMADSRKVLEDKLGQPIEFLAYPYGGVGNFRPEYLALAYETGYRAVFSACDGFVEPGMLGEVLPRVPVPAFPSLLNLELHLTGCLEWFYRLKRRRA